ncbi:MULTISPECIES: IS3 family transposase [Bradyrhizobium]|uniref:IS3 family transposase n=1 Tax=Bradyrhizobium TaxID=374 RepID=UPI0012FA65F8
MVRRTLCCSIGRIRQTRRSISPSSSMTLAVGIELRDLIQRICLKHIFYGYRRVTAAVRRQGMVVNAKKVQRLMREDNLLAQRKTPLLKPPSERPSGFLVVPNLVRGLVPSAPDQIWVADITYVHLARTFAYLAVILDAFSRKAVGWAFDDTLDASLAISALEKAIAARRPARGSLIHHWIAACNTPRSPIANGLPIGTSR